MAYWCGVFGWRCYLPCRYATPARLLAETCHGMFPNFGESMKNHMIEKRTPVFPTFTFVDMWMKHYTGHSMKYGPINVISGVRTPLLMLHSKEDLYSTPGICREALQPFGIRKQAARLVSSRQTLNAQNNRHRALRRLDN